jgi:hypothetical protein
VPRKYSEAERQRALERADEMIRTNATENVEHCMKFIEQFREQTRGFIEDWLNRFSRYDNDEIDLLSDLIRNRLDGGNWESLNTTLAKTLDGKRLLDTINARLQKLQMVIDVNTPAIEFSRKILKDYGE